MEKKKKQETQESKYSKAQASAVTLVENIMSNIENSTEKRLNQAHLQNIKKYYREEYRHFFEFINLIYALLASFICYAFLPNYVENSYQIFGMLIIALGFLRYSYDDNLSTFVYLQKMIGSFTAKNLNEEKLKKITSIDIVRYLEKKVFEEFFIINYKMYFILTIFALAILTFGYFQNEPKTLMILPFFAFLNLANFLFFVKSNEYK